MIYFVIINIHIYDGELLKNKVFWRETFSVNAFHMLAKTKPADQYTRGVRCVHVGGGGGGGRGDPLINITNILNLEMSTVKPAKLDAC